VAGGRRGWLAGSVDEERVGWRLRLFIFLLNILFTFKEMLSVSAGLM
jgi:hypothetical protein